METVDLSALSPEAQDAREHAIDMFVWEALPDLTDASLATARRLGKVVKEQVRHEDNENIPGQTVEIRTLVFDGLELEGWVDEKQDLRVSMVKITKGGWRVRDGLGVGASTQHLVTVLGPPSKRTGELLEYSGETETAQFTIRDGKIFKVMLIHYTG